MNTYSSWRTRRKDNARKRFQAMARESNRVQAAKRAVREPNADTLRRRAADDARCGVLRAGSIYGPALCVTWAVVRSRYGKANQVDCEIGGECVLTCSRREANKWADGLIKIPAKKGLRRGAIREL
jgi:hypothetical protein